MALCVLVVCWVAGFIFIESLGSPVQSAETGFVTYRKADWVLGMRWFYLFGLLWISQFIIACQHCVVAGAVATWYFAK